MHCPIICSRIEGNIDIVEHGKTGLLFEVKNEKELFQQMKYALDNPALLQQNAIALRRQIEQHFDQPIVHSFLLKKYRELLTT
jgi:glycosyltransferase involved in cell wall biosynthesis